MGYKEFKILSLKGGLRICEPVSPELSGRGVEPWTPRRPSLGLSLPLCRRNVREWVSQGLGIGSRGAGCSDPPGLPECPLLCRGRVGPLICLPAGSPGGPLALLRGVISPCLSSQASEFTWEVQANSRSYHNQFKEKVYLCWQRKKYKVGRPNPRGPSGPATQALHAGSVHLVLRTVAPPSPSRGVRCWRFACLLHPK